MNGGIEYEFPFSTLYLSHFFPQNDAYCIGFTQTSWAQLFFLFCPNRPFYSFIGNDPFGGGGHAHSVWKFPDQGLNQSLNRDNTGSLSCWSMREPLPKLDAPFLARADQEVAHFLFCTNSMPKLALRALYKLYFTEFQNNFSN